MTLRTKRHKNFQSNIVSIYSDYLNLFKQFVVLSSMCLPQQHQIMFFQKVMFKTQETKEKSLVGFCSHFLLLLFSFIIFFFYIECRNCNIKEHSIRAVSLFYFQSINNLPINIWTTQCKFIHSINNNTWDILCHAALHAQKCTQLVVSLLWRKNHIGRQSFYISR